MSGAAFRPLLPPGGAPLTAAEVVAAVAMRERAPAGRPYVGVNMIATLDGHVTIRGRTAPIANAADHELFHALRAGADAVLVGAHTVRVEGYGPLDRLAVVVTRSLDLPVQRGLLAAPGNHVVIVTADRQASLPPCAAHVSYLRTGDLGEALARLHAEHGVRAVVCEGGPRLNSTLLPAGLVDDLFVSIAPMLAGGEALTLLGGPPLDPPLDLELAALYESGGYLFSRYEPRR